MTDDRLQRAHGRRLIGLAALGVNSGRSYIVALLQIVIYPLAAAVLFGIVVGLTDVFARRPPDNSDPLAAIIEQYGLIVVAGAAVVHGAAHVHRRPWRSLVAPDLRLDWRRLAIGLAAELAILTGQLALVHLLTGWPWGLSLEAGLPVLALGLVLIPLQAASEELLFRGYLTQALGRVFASRVLIALVVAAIFGALHLNAYGPLTVPYFLLVSLIFSLVSLRDDRLELAIGGHAAMNLFAFAAANFGLLRPAILGTEAGAVQFNGAALVVLTVNGALFYGITRLLVRLCCREQVP